MFWVGLALGILTGLLLEVFLLANGMAVINFYDEEGTEITNTEYRKRLEKSK